MKQAFESRLNIALSVLLNRAGIGARPEYKGSGRKDVLIHYNGLRIVIEGSFGQKDAEKDARHRIDQLAADIAIAVFYPSQFPQDISESEISRRLRSEKLMVKIFIPEDISGTLWEILHKKKVISQNYGEWLTAKVDLLTTIIKEVAQLIVNEEAIHEIEKRVESVVENVLNSIAGHSQSDQIAGTIYDTLYKLYGFSIGDPTKIKEPLFAQTTLAILLATVYYEAIRQTHKLPSVREYETRHSSAREGIEEAIRAILSINYEPIFDLVRSLLDCLPPLENSFRRILDLATEIRTKRALLRRDLGGKVYHRIVGSWALRKGLATFYTQVPSAYFLLHLAKPKLGRIADFACGSGTLLLAAYSAMDAANRFDLWEKGIDHSPKEIERRFHRAFLANCHAFDVLGYALQITILNLVLHSPETQIDGILPSQIIPLGYREKDDSVSLGSLELARRNPRFDRIMTGVKQMGITGSRIISLTELTRIGFFDLIVMNPPFSRTTGRGGKEGGGLFGFVSNSNDRNIILSDYNSLRKEIRQELISIARNLLNGSALSFVLYDSDFSMFRQIWQAGEGLLFIYLADTHIDKNGKICFVLPRGLLSGVSWFLARTLLLSRYHIEYVIVSYDADNYNFSESTSLAECMFIAKRKDDHKPEDVTKFVLLLKKPGTSIEAIALAQEIGSSEEEYVQSGNTRGFVSSVTRASMQKYVDNWGRFAFLPELSLLNQVSNLLDGHIRIGEKQCRLPMIPFHNLIETIGVDAHRFTDTFRVVREFVPGGLDALIGGDEEFRLQMSISPNAWVLPITSKARDMFNFKSGSLLVPDRIWIDTAHVVSMLSDKKIVANVFYVVQMKKDTLFRRKALCLWLNTTWGILSVLASRQDTRGGFIRLKMTHWRTLPVLDLDKLDDSTIQRLASLYDTFKDQTFDRIPVQYGYKGKPDDARIKLDREFLSVFGLSVSRDELMNVYQPLSQAFKQWLGE